MRVVNLKFVYILISNGVWKYGYINEMKCMCYC